MLRRKLSSFCANINYPRRSKIVHFKACRDELKSYNVETLIDSKGIRHIVALMFDCKSMHFFFASIFIVCDFYLVVKHLSGYIGNFFHLLNKRFTAVRNQNSFNCKRRAINIFNCFWDWSAFRCCIFMTFMMIFNFRGKLNFLKKSVKTIKILIIKFSLSQPFLFVIKNRDHSLQGIYVEWAINRARIFFLIFFPLLISTWLSSLIFY